MVEDDDLGLLNIRLKQNPAIRGTRMSARVTALTSLIWPDEPAPLMV